MGMYNIYQWLIFFYIYCFLGWCIESTIVSVEDKRLVNRGFLNGPFLPIYGFGAIIVLFITLPFKKNIIEVYFLGMIGATILEYFTGCLMEAIFKIKYWDYSYYKIQYKGRICLVSSLFWGVLSVLLTYFIHKPIEKYVLNLNSTLIIFLDIVISIFFVADIIVSAKASIDLNKLIEKSSKVFYEIKDLNRQIEDLIVRYGREISVDREHSNKIMESINLLKEKIDTMSLNIKKEYSKLNYMKNRILKDHPTGSFIKFNFKFKDFKETILNKYDAEKNIMENRRKQFIEKFKL